MKGFLGEGPVLVPPPTSTDDFEICKLPSKRQLQAQSQFGGFEILDPQKPVRDCGISGWEVLFLQFNNPETRKSNPSLLPNVPSNTTVGCSQTNRCRLHISCHPLMTMKTTRHRLPYKKWMRMNPRRKLMRKERGNGRLIRLTIELPFVVY